MPVMTEHSRWHNFLPGILRQFIFTGVESNGILSEGRHIRFLSGGPRINVYISPFSVRKCSKSWIW